MFQSYKTANKAAPEVVKTASKMMSEGQDNGTYLSVSRDEKSNF